MSPLVSLTILPCAFFAAGPSSYDTALREAETKNQPLVVLVGADWCPGCRTMKQRVLPALVRRGAFRGASLAVVDTDRESSLAGQLMRGGAIPQLIVFSRDGEGEWRRQQITGATSEASIQALVAQALGTGQTSRPGSAALTDPSGSAGH